MFSYTRTNPLITTFIIFLLATGMGLYIDHSYRTDDTLHKSVLCEPVLTVNMCENLTMLTQESGLDLGQLSLSGEDKCKKTTLKHNTVRRKTIHKKTAPKLCAGMDL